MYAHIIAQDKKPNSMISLFVSLGDLVWLILLLLSSSGLSWALCADQQ